MRLPRLITTASFVAAAGCNLLTGASDLDIGEESPVEPGGSDAGVLPDPDARPSDGARTDVGTDRDASDARAEADVDGGPVVGAKRVFVTSTKTTGDMNGVAGGDMACAALVASAGLGGSWVAWLSVQGADAIDRLKHNGPWYLVDRMTIAVASKTQLAGVTITHAIDRDEKGTLVSDDEVWTGTLNGKSVPENCNGWNSLQLPLTGTSGRTSEVDGDWTDSGDSLCATQHRLYCFEN